MPINKVVYRIVVASPSDVQAERDVVEEIVNEINIAEKMNRVEFEVARWEIDVAPSFHVLDEQGVIDPSFNIKDTDVFIGIFHMKFGISTVEASTGTEPEWKQLVETFEKTDSPKRKLYFKKAANVNLEEYTEEEIKQYLKVRDLKKQNMEKGCIAEFESIQEFKDNLKEHLNEFLEEQKDTKSNELQGHSFERSVDSEWMSKYEQSPRDIVDELAFAFCKIGKHLLKQGQVEEALNKFEESKEIFQKIGKRADVAECLENMGEIYKTKKLHSEALTCFNEALENYVYIGDKVGTAGALENIGWNYIYLHQLQEGNRYLEKSLNIYKSMDTETSKCNYLRILGEIHEYQEINQEKKSSLEGQSAIGNDTMLHSKTVGRNDPCHCGSGKKYKNCCYDEDKNRKNS